MEWLQKAGDLLDKLDKTAAEQLNAHDEDAEVRAPCPQPHEVNCFHLFQNRNLTCRVNAQHLLCRGFPGS